MHFTISSEALNRAVKKVVQVTPSRATGDVKEVQIEALDEGVLVRRQGSDAYAEFFIYAAVKEKGSVVVGSDGLRFLEYCVGDITFDLKGEIISISPGDTKVRTMDSPPDYYSRKEPEGEWFACSPEVLNVLWANPDELDIVWGYAFMEEDFLAATNRFNFAVVSLNRQPTLPGLEPGRPDKLVFPLMSLKGMADLKEGETFQMAAGGNLVWFKHGGFVMASALAADRLAAFPPFFRSILELELEDQPYFILETKTFVRQIQKVIAHATMATLKNEARCYLELRENGELYFESNWSERGQVKDTLQAEASRGSFSFSFVPQNLTGLFGVLTPEITVRLLELPGLQGVWPILVHKNSRFVITPTSDAWREDARP